MNEKLMAAMTAAGITPPVHIEADGILHCFSLMETISTQKMVGMFCTAASFAVFVRCKGVSDD